MADDRHGIDFDLIERHIEEHGVSLLHVAEDYRHPYFSYTIGLNRVLGKPEVLVIGIPQEVAHTLLNEVAARLGAGEDLAALDEELLEGSILKTRPVPRRLHAEYLGVACTFAGGAIEAVQLLWSDRNGRFPDDPGCHPFVVNHQPILSSVITRYDNPAWAFQEPRDAKAYTTDAILSGEAELGFVARTDERKWLFLTDEDEAHTSLVCVTLSEMLERFPPLMGLAELPAGESVWLEEPE